MGKDISKAVFRFSRETEPIVFDLSLSLTTPVCCCSVTKSCSTLRPRGMQHARQLCPPLSPGDCSNSCPLSRCCYLTISSSSTLFSFCLRSFPASGFFLMSQLFVSEGQSMFLLKTVEDCGCRRRSSRGHDHQLTKRPDLAGQSGAPHLIAWCSVRFSSVQSLSRVRLFATP